MATYSNNAIQTINPGESAIFTQTIVPCTRGFIKHRDETGSFLLSGYVPYNTFGCGCNRDSGANYLVDFGANIAIPADADVGDISVAIEVDGATVPASTMIVTPAATEEYFNVSRAINIDVFRGCCENMTIRNTSDIPILMQNAIIMITRPDLVVSK